MNKVWIFDVDGTLANNEHRVRHLTQHTRKDWDAFFAEQHLDDPYVPVFDIMKSLEMRGDICIIITGRDEKYRETTLKWINEHHDGVFHDYNLYMRPHNDHRDDFVIKLEIIDEFLKEFPESRIQGVFEDRHSVIDAWRDRGYYVFECNQTRSDF